MRQVKRLRARYVRKAFLQAEDIEFNETELRNVIPKKKVTTGFKGSI